jgi:tetratricopeptide (TPR) repeat protein
LEQRDKWAWDQPELQEQVLLLRRIVADPEFRTLNRVYRAQILTNLGNIFSTLGRVVEGVKYRDRALEARPKFGMALGTRAESLVAYGSALYRVGDTGAFFRAAHRGFANTTDEDTYYESDYTATRKKWRGRVAELEKWLKANRLDAPIDRPSGSTEEERAYWDWCAAQRLFLDPLNDLGGEAVAGADRLHLPAIVPHDARSEMLVGYLDAMQQEYASARWTLYEALTIEEKHFSDSALAPHDTGDEPVYGLRMERLKSTYRLAYSIFDKIAFFLDAYFALGIKKVSFRRVWDKTKATAFASKENWPLRGLYWLSRDLFEEDFMGVTEPEAQAITEIRNHLEHKYLRVVRDYPSAGAATFATDPLAYVVTQSDFERHAAHLLELARAALIYLVLAVHSEERRKKMDGVTGPKTKLPRL